MKFSSHYINKQFKKCVYTTKISGCLGANLRTVQRIGKELNESNGGWLHFDRSDIKRTTDFLGEIQYMIEKRSQRVDHVYR